MILRIRQAGETFNLHLDDSVLEHQASLVKVLRLLRLDSPLLLLLLSQCLLILALGLPFLHLRPFESPGIIIDGETGVADRGTVTGGEPSASGD